jgi:hypothetical protein
MSTSVRTPHLLLTRTTRSHLLQTRRDEMLIRLKPVTRLSQLLALGNPILSGELYHGRYRSVSNMWTL